MNAIRPTIALCGEHDVVDALTRALKPKFELFFPTWSGNRPVLPSTVSAIVAVHVPVPSSFPSTIPLVQIGGTATKSSACWFAVMPPVDTLVTVLYQVTRIEPRFEPEPRSWRRKSDLIVGSSDVIRQLLRALDRLARSAAPVLVVGESGTGKELAARAQHYGSQRAAAPFVAINSAAIHEALFEAELFGHQRGAFTGAVAARAGAFESADAGTLLLDEIGEMPVPLQAKLLRVLETGEVTRLGATTPKRINVRLVTATNRSLEDDAQHGRFREDLYYRVSVHTVHIPPLRERFDDIPALVHHHLEEIARREKREAVGATPAAIEKLLSYRWPGNVRELVNVLERAVMYANGAAIDVAHVTLPVASSSTPLIVPYRDAKEQFEHAYYSQVLRAAGGNISRVAKLAQKTRKEVYEAMRRLGLDVGEYRESSGQFPAAHAVQEEEDDAAEDG